MITLSQPIGLERQVLHTARGPLIGSYAGPRAQHDTGTAVVLVSGYVGSKEDFWPLLPLIAQAGYHGWSYDQLGQFESGGPADPGAYTIELLADDLRSVMAQAGGGAPVHLVGHCLGGFVARTATLADPAAVQSLTMIACGPNMSGPGHRRILAELDSRLDIGGFELLWPFIKRLIPERDAPTRDFWYTKLRATDTGFMRGTARSVGAERDRCAELRASGVPVLVMYGKRDRRLWSRGDYVDMADELGAELAVIDRASHNPHQERPEQTLEVLLGLWSRRYTGVCS